MYINSLDLSQFTPLGSANYPAYSLYQSITQVIALRVSDQTAALLAQPIFDQTGGQIDYTSETEGDLKRLIDLSDAEQSVAMALLREGAEQVKALSATFLETDDPEKQRFGQTLRNTLYIPSIDYIFLVNGHPVLTGWGLQTRSGGKPFDAGGIAKPEVAPAVVETQPQVEEPTVQTQPETETKEQPQVAATPKAQSYASEPKRKGFPWWLLLLLVLLLLGLLWLFSYLFNQPSERLNSSNSDSTTPAISMPNFTPTEEQQNPDTGTQGETAGLTTNQESPLKEQQELHISEDSLNEKDLSFLEGNWRSITALISSVSRKNVIISYQFNQNGEGVTSIEQSPSSICTTNAKAEIRENRQLHIEDEGDVLCPDGSFFTKSKVVCTVLEGGKADCRGEQDDNIYKVSFVRGQ